jgi:hypothetical protein
MTMTGPFAETSEMTYSDKKSTALAITPRFDLNLVWAPTLLDSDANRMHYNLTYGWDGTILLRISEPMSGQFLWQKRIVLDKAKTTAAIDAQWPQPLPGTMDLAVLNQESRNKFAQATEVVYKEVMASLDKWVTVEEFQELEKQAQEIKAKKVF